MSEALDTGGLPTVASYWPGYDNTATDEAKSKPYTRSGKTQKELLNCYLLRTTISKKWRKDKYDDTWKRLVNLYKGKQLIGQSKDDRIVINIAFSTVNVIVPSVAVNDPKITVNARTEQATGAAETAEAAINYWWRHFDWKHEVKRSVKDAIVIGHGWIKVGWRYQERARETTPEEQQAQYAQMRQEADLAAFANPAIAADLPSDEEIYEGVEKQVFEPELDCPFVERVSPNDIFIDPEATYPGDLKWIAQRIVAPLDQVKRDSRYDQGARNDLKADMSTNARWRDDPSGDATADAANDDIKRVTLWEYWDIEHDFYCVFASNAKRFLLKPTECPYPFGHPFFFLPNYEVTDQFYPLGDLEMIEPIQYELNGVRSDMMNHRKRYQRAYLYLRDKFGADGVAALGSSEDGRMVPVDGDEDLNRLVVPIAQESLDPQMYSYSEQIESDLELVSGVTEFQRGSAPEVRRTATEASMLQNATNARVSDKLAQVEIFMAEIAEAVIQLAQMYMTQEEAAKIVGQNGEVQWMTFTPEAIQGEFDFTVEAGSTQPKDENFKRTQALELFGTMQEFVGTVVDPTALVTYVLRDGFGIKDPSKFLMQQAPPEEDADDKVIINYKDAPPDIQRQIEAAAGYKPSKMGGSSPIEVNDNALPAALGEEAPAPEAQMAAQYAMENPQEPEAPPAEAAV